MPIAAPLNAHPPAAWRRWGPYLSQRAWGTVREDYSPDGDAWNFLPFARASRLAYRWNEDGLLGWCDDQQRLCLGLGLWNGQDPILKERPFGLSGHQGNHGEDVQDLVLLDEALPSLAWAKQRYLYPVGPFPYEAIVAEAARRSRAEAEPHLWELGAYREGFWAVESCLAKATPEAFVLRHRVRLHAPQSAPLDLLQLAWCRNTWSWSDPPAPPPRLVHLPAPRPGLWALAWLPAEGQAPLGVLVGEGPAEALACDNASDLARHWPGATNPSPHPKGAIEDAVVHGDPSGLRPEGWGTRVGLRFRLKLPPQGEATLHLAFAPSLAEALRLLDAAQALVAERQAEHEAHWAERLARVPEALRPTARRAWAGLILNQAFYHLDVGPWLDGDPGQPPPPSGRKAIRNGAWRHLRIAQVLSMPDPWEYPWFAAWDLALHAVAGAAYDPDWAKAQLGALLAPGALGPDGALPAYEWAFGDANPPLHAWACRRVAHMERAQTGRLDAAFLKRSLLALLQHLGWWHARQDQAGDCLFEGGFLGLDNVGVLDRAALAKTGGASLEQADGTAWAMALTLQLLGMALDLVAEGDAAFEELAVRLLGQALAIDEAMHCDGAHGRPSLWHEGFGLYLDVLKLPDGGARPLEARSLVAMLPLVASLHLPAELLAKAPALLEAIAHHEARGALTHTPGLAHPDAEGGRFLALVDAPQWPRLARWLLDEAELLGPYGPRSLSLAHRDAPLVLALGDGHHRLAYEPGESESPMFGGNSNWRGPVWAPTVVLLVDGLMALDAHLGEAGAVPTPWPDGPPKRPAEVARLLAERFLRLYTPGPQGEPGPANAPWLTHPGFPQVEGQQYFFEYHHADSGAGLGANHQTGWTAWVANLALWLAGEGLSCGLPPLPQGQTGH